MPSKHTHISTLNCSYRLLLAACTVLSVTWLQATVSANATSAPMQSSETPDRRATVARSRANTAVAITAIRNLEDEAWLERLEIEVKNVSTKPIFYLQIQVGFPGVAINEPDGLPRVLIMPLSHGRRDLLREGNVATGQDVPIQPGETYVLRIPEQYRTGLQERITLGTVPESAVKRIGITVDSLSFGDGTGVRSGVPFSSPK